MLQGTTIGPEMEVTQLYILYLLTTYTLYYYQLVWDKYYVSYYNPPYHYILNFILYYITSNIYIFYIYSVLYTVLV